MPPLDTLGLGMILLGIPAALLVSTVAVCMRRRWGRVALAISVADVAAFVVLMLHELHVL